jgi:hypothetical protein
MPRIMVIYDATRVKTADMGINYSVRLDAEGWPVTSLDELLSDLGRSQAARTQIR